MRDPATEKFCSEYEKTELVRRLCARRFGVGADGAVFIHAPKNGADFAWEYFNTDGSPANMCGNAARCIGLWGCLHVTEKSQCSFETAIGVLKAHISEDNLVEVAVPMPSFEVQPFDVGLMHGAVNANLVNVGVPHIVIEMNVWPPRDVQKPKIASLRRHPLLGQEGANVTLMMRNKDGSTSAVTFERGVEDFTLSCGTGVMAAGLVLGGSDKRMRVTNPGGELTIRFDKNEKVAYLGGRVSIIFKAYLNKEILN
jgi:diaminopimelate epimerase